MLCRFGRFPMFWQDLATWPGWEEAKRGFMQEQEKVHIQESNKNKRVRNRWGDATNLLKKTRWDSTRRRIQPGMSEAIEQGYISLERLQVILHRVHIEDVLNSLDTVNQDAEQSAADPNRSPSPPPVFDINGKRVNTREWRMRKKLETERNDIIDEIMALNPSLKVRWFGE